jgi:hypothetical protein
MPGLLLVSVVPLLGAFLLGALDGIYFHLRRYRLFAFPESRREHVIHTVRAALVLPPLALLYLADAAGLCLWTAAASIAVDQLMLALDLREEATSRRRFGGLAPAEYQIHVVANGLHGVALALALASRPTGAWSLDACSLGESSLPLAIQALVAVLWLSSAVAAIQHVALLFGAQEQTSVAAP